MATASNACTLRLRLRSPEGEATPLALYVHWPFCVSKCPYCDFNSHVRDASTRTRGATPCSPTWRMKRRSSPTTA